MRNRNQKVQEKVLPKALQQKGLARGKYGFNVSSYDDTILYKVNNEVKVY